MTFTELNISEPLLRAIAEEGYTNPTPIQVQSIPPLLEGNDLLGIAQTGTGKTAAFVLPLIMRLSGGRSNPGAPRALILAPTRELAAQINASIGTYGRYVKIKRAVIFGGVGQNPQVSSLRRGVDILVATPGRLLDLLNQGHLTLMDVGILILDEADRMLDMGFIHDIKRIIAKVPVKRQTMFFSATMPPEVSKLAHSMLNSPVHVEVAPQATTVERVEQYVCFVDTKAKEELLMRLLKEDRERVLIFTKTKHRANKLAKTLTVNGFKAEAIHGNKSQTARTKALGDFSSGKVRILVATDIAARGIDVEGISHVINFELPMEPESYVHRIGRTARAGADGIAYTFCAAEERDLLRAIEKIARIEIPVKEHQWHSERAQNATGSAARTPGRKKANHPMKRRPAPGPSNRNRSARQKRNTKR
jgi:ATP-dependent RNA helicase RhlE